MCRIPRARAARIEVQGACISGAVVVIRRTHSQGIAIDAQRTAKVVIRCSVRRSLRRENNNNNNNNNDDDDDDDDEEEEEEKEEE